MKNRKKNLFSFFIMLTFFSLFNSLPLFCQKKSEKIETKKEIKNEDYTKIEFHIDSSLYLPAAKINSFFNPPFTPWSLTSDEEKSNKKDSALKKSIKSLSPLFNYGINAEKKDLKVLVGINMKKTCIDDIFYQKNISFLKNLNTITEKKIAVHWSHNFPLENFPNSKQSPFFHTSVLAGNITYGRSLSRIKNPFLSPSSSIKTAKEDKGGFKASLPSWSSNPSPSISTLFSFNSEKIELSLETSFFSSSGAASCLSVRPELPVTFTLSAALFPYSKTGGKNWFLTSPFISEKKRLFLKAESSIKKGPFISNFSFSADENPFGSPSFHAKNQTFVTVNFFKLLIGGVFADKKLYLTDGTDENRKWQFLINPSLHFKTESGKTEGGILCMFEKLHEEESEKSSFRHTLMMDFIFKKNEISLKHSSSLKVLSLLYTEEKNEYINNSKNTFSFSSKTSLTLPVKNINCTGTASFSLYNGSKSFSTKLSFPLKSRIFSSFSSSTKLTFKNSSISGGLQSFTLTFEGGKNKKKLKKDKSKNNKIRITGRLKVNIEF